MHGEVAAVMGVLPGAVHRIDDPHTIRLEAQEVVLGLLAENRVVRKLLAQSSEDVVVTRAICEFRERFRRIDVVEVGCLLLPETQQQQTRIHGDGVCAFVIAIVCHQELKSFCALSRPCVTSVSMPSAARSKKSTSAFRSAPLNGLRTKSAGSC